MKKNNENKNVNDKSKDEDEICVKDKLELLTLILPSFVSITKYAEYKVNIRKINEKVKILKFIKDSLMIFSIEIYLMKI